MNEETCSMCHEDTPTVSMGIVGPSSRVLLFTTKHGIRIGNPDRLAVNAPAGSTPMAIRWADFCRDCFANEWGQNQPPGQFLLASEEAVSDGRGPVSGLVLLDPDVHIITSAFTFVVNNLEGIEEGNWFVCWDLEPGWLGGMFVANGLEEVALDDLKGVGIKASAFRALDFGFGSTGDVSDMGDMGDNEPTTNEEIAEEIQRDRDEQDERDRLKDERIDAESERAAIRTTVAEAADNLIEAADDGRLEALVAEAEAAGHDDRADYYRALIVMAHAAT